MLESISFGETGDTRRLIEISTGLEAEHMYTVLLYHRVYASLT